MNFRLALKKFFYNRLFFHRCNKMMLFNINFITLSPPFIKTIIGRLNRRITIP